MALVHEQMYQSNDFTTIDLGAYIQNLTKRLVASSRQFGTEIDITEKVYLTLELAVPCGIVINELINNSLAHAFPDSWTGKKKIRISVRRMKNNKIDLVVADNGVGFPKKFNFRESESLGLKLVTILVEEQLNGKIKLVKGSGTTFHIIFKESE
jgi:two-component sensor histidine kinase